jgi:hypothetical protein
MKTTYSLLFLFLMMFVTSCKRQIPFDEESWNNGYDGFYNHREFMVEDLQQNYLKSKIHYNDVVKLLGTNGEYHDSTDIELHYEIFVDYGWDIDPVETKSLIINFLPDSTYVSSEISHWKNN